MSVFDGFSCSRCRVQDPAASTVRFDLAALQKLHSDEEDRRQRMEAALQHFREEEERSERGLAAAEALRLADKERRRHGEMMEQECQAAEAREARAVSEDAEAHGAYEAVATAAATASAEAERLQLDQELKEWAVGWL